MQDLNRLLKMHRQMADVMKKMGGMGKKGLLRGGLGALFGKGGGRPAGRCRGAGGMPGAASGGADAAAGRLALPPGLLRPRPEEMTSARDPG